MRSVGTLWLLHCDCRTITRAWRGGRVQLVLGLRLGVQPALLLPRPHNGGRHVMYRWYLTNPVRIGRPLKVEVQNRPGRSPAVPCRDELISIAV